MKAPRSWPNSSLSSSSRATAAQLTLTKRTRPPGPEIVDGARDQLLAGARLAGDQNGHIDARRLLDDVEDFLHPRALPESELLTHPRGRVGVVGPVRLSGWRGLRHHIGKQRHGRVWLHRPRCPLSSDVIGVEPDRDAVDPSPWLDANHDALTGDLPRSVGFDPLEEQREADGRPGPQPAVRREEHSRSADIACRPLPARERHGERYWEPRRLTPFAPWRVAQVHRAKVSVSGGRHNRPLGGFASGRGLDRRLPRRWTGGPPAIETNLYHPIEPASLLGDYPPTCAVIVTGCRADDRSVKEGSVRAARPPMCVPRPGGDPGGGAGPAVPERW